MAAPITIVLRRRTPDSPYVGKVGAIEETMKLRRVVITIAADSADALSSIEPFLRQAISECDNGSMIVHSIEVVEVPKESAK